MGVCSHRVVLIGVRKRVVNVTIEVAYSVPVGRITPDALLRNGGDYVVETKLVLKPSF